MLQQSIEKVEGRLFYQHTKKTEFMHKNPLEELTHRSSLDRPGQSRIPTSALYKSNVLDDGV
ncbi:hypothetical protein KY290_021587 [Solanum tuberosum]|uniref:Uncharacterized protein n=1 Tax=Solanum tuberosum TaxID=4113 RepID=A0ABQ7V3J0_SOLTU|nr:hypothetical protein KY289_020747 [Solanum tuberosum]KAH0758094.1 hypothetical protein KY290_021587 [Solanum tuberosum]